MGCVIIEEGAMDVASEKKNPQMRSKIEAKMNSRWFESSRRTKIELKNG